MAVNLLILSAGTRNKVVQYFRQALRGCGRVIAADMQAIAPALYEADDFVIVPRITDPDYLNVLFALCQREHITGVLSLIDPELGLLAAHEAEFRALGVTVIGSDEALCRMSLDKMQMYHWLTGHGYRTARSYDDREDFYRDVRRGRMQYPVFVKPIRGSASVAISRAENREEVEFLFGRTKDLMIQELMQGQEIGADVYVDLISGRVVSVFTRKKLRMRAGETDKAVSFRDPALFTLIERFVQEAGYRGQVDIDLFEVQGQYYISEVNPRFGGGYPHAFACGVDHMTMIKNNLLGLVNPRRIGCYEEGLCMMKYSELLVRRVGPEELR